MPERFRLPDWQICTASGACVPGQTCVADSSCQSNDPLDRCYRYSRQCTCDSVCRLRKAACDECSSDLECGSDVVIFGPPEGLGVGRCKTLPNDTSGKKYCLYERVIQCDCGTIDDGTGFCRPVSNSCSVVGCNVDQMCPTNSICSVDQPDAGRLSCGGTCIPTATPCMGSTSSPVAQLSACSPAQLVNDPECTLGATTFSLATIAPDELTLSAVNSTDDHLVAEYRFTLLPPLPAGATTAALASHGVRMATKKTKLTIPAGVAGAYRVGLEVWDDCGQKSATTAVINLNVVP